MSIFVVDDFSGGITENHISAPPSKYQKADNLLIIKHKTNAKMKSRPGSRLYDSAHPRLPTGNQRVGHIEISFDKLFAQSGRRMYYYDTTGWLELLGPTTNPVFASSFLASNRILTGQWNNHLFITNDAFERPSKIYPNNSGVPTLRTAGLPKLASTPTGTGTAGAQNFIYRFIYSYTYQVNTLTFKDESAYVQRSVLNVNAPDVNAITIGSIPVLANGSTTNWDTANIKVEIYRTTNNGTTFYYVGEVTNGTTTFNDNIADSTIQTNLLLYTEGGVVQNDEPPLSKFLTITGDNGIAWYAHIKEGSEIKKNRVRQSLPSNPDACPASFYVDVAEDIEGISSVRGFPIVICDNAAYRLEGFFDDVGQGGIETIKISDTASCISAKSIVQTLDGIFWCGKDGIYFSDGFKVLRVNDGWAEETYKQLVETSGQQSFIQGAYDKVGRRIWWTFEEDLASAEADKCYVLHLDFGVSDDMPFTSASNGSYFYPSSIYFDDIGRMIRGDKRGYVLLHTEDDASDPKIDTSLAATDWERRAIIYDYRSSAFDLGSTADRKYVTKIILTCKNRTNISTQIISNNDDNKKIAKLSPIRFRGNLTWGDPLPVWGDPDLVWNFDGIIEEQRRFPAKSLRCSYKQIQITNAYVNIYNSDSLGTVTTDATSKVVTLTDALTLDWPAYLVDYFISFEDDNYTNEFLITAQTADTLTYQDPLSLTTSGANKKWVIKGVPKDEIINILSYTLEYQVFGITQQPYRTSNAGGVSET
jgi:hypothetical protein